MKPLKLTLGSNKGLILEQKKEPALSRDLEELLVEPELLAAMDEQEEPVEPLDPAEELTPLRLYRLCRQANIIDEREGQPLEKLLRRYEGRKLNALVGDAIDDEPYVSSQTNPLMKLSAQAAYGLELLERAFAPKRAYFAVYKEMYYLNSRIPTKIGKYQVRRIGGKYPMEQRAVNRLGKDVLTVGVCALIHLARAAQEGRRQHSCFVTVAGNCVSHAANVEVTIGTPLQKLLDHCGLLADPLQLAIGSALKGQPVADPLEETAQPRTRALLAIRETAELRHPMDCIGCGRCVGVCPENLNPIQLYRAARNGRRQTAGALGLFHCSGCAACSYVCPSRLELSDLLQRRQAQWREEAKRHESK